MQYRAFHFSLPKYLIQKLERDIQKKAMSIICPGVSYHETLVIMNFKETSNFKQPTTKGTRTKGGLPVVPRKRMGEESCSSVQPHPQSLLKI